MEAMAEVRRRDALDVWKFSCPTCFADPGVCSLAMTRTRRDAMYCRQAYCRLKALASIGRGIRQVNVGAGT